MNKDQGTGIIERALYGVISVLLIKYGAMFGLTTDDAAWLAGGAIALGGGVIAFVRNRPVSVLNRAADAIPDNTKLVIAIPPNASSIEKEEAKSLATAASDKVIAKVI